MKTTSNRNHCVLCNKEELILRCGRCLKDFCFNYLSDYRHELSKQSDVIERNYDIFQQKLIDHTVNLQNNILVKEIND